ncbi:ABC transporter substrate-binding protein [Motiliproteus sediminis]|uniref:ABC transporter substrate-binding protein n=1 Tax=Motiliproteus sediminis TaxID=1468178 RepID=UPI001AEF5DBC|nr:ABC transporter substrate-binding protein [Motiliproteus sediminis]
MAERCQTAPLGTLTAAFERSGSPYWLMDCIQQQGFDRRHGFELRVNYGDDQWQQGRHATEAALLAGEVDFIDCDWLTLLRCRAEGAAISAVYPYGRVLGGLVVPPASAIGDLDDLMGARIGIVNRRDKNWQLLCAYGRQLHDLDLDDRCRVLEAGSKTTLADWLRNGLLDAAVVYWHQLPALQQQGYRLLVDIPLLLPALGLDPTPTTFFLFRDALIREQPALIRAFIAALNDARQQLQRGDAWQRIGAELLAIDNPELLAQLRRIWNNRIGQPWQPDQISGLWSLTQIVAPANAGSCTQTEFNKAFAWDFLQAPAMP